MKTLLLTSSGKFITTEQGMNVFSKPLNKMKMAYITTASNGVEDKSYIEQHKVKMEELKFDFEEVDIQGKNKEYLIKILQDKEVIYVEGGNTFYLLKAVKESGFDKMVKELVSQGMVYIGSSAGSYICCPTIEMATWKHQDRFNHCGLEDLTALNLVPFLITAHYEIKYKEVVKRGIAKTKYPVKILTDRQALLVQDNQVRLIGEDKEVNL